MQSKTKDGCGVGNNAEYYEKNGKRYDRITRILDYFPHPDLVDWKIDVGRREARRVSTAATNIGDNVDEYVKQKLLGGKLPKLKTQEAKNCLEAFESWVAAYSPVLKVGETVFDDALMVAGTPDLIWNDTLIDIKCSREIKHSYWLQTEFYARCLGVQYKAVLRLDKNLAMFEYKKMKLSDDDWAACRAAITLHRFYNKTLRDVAHPKGKKGKGEVSNDSNLNITYSPV